MIQMKWRADSENSENSALDTIIVTHKIYEKKYFLIGLTLLRRIEQLNTLLVYLVYQGIPQYSSTIHGMACGTVPGLVWYHTTAKPQVKGTSKKTVK